MVDEHGEGGETQNGTLVGQRWDRGFWIDLSGQDPDPGALFLRQVLQLGVSDQEDSVMLDFLSRHN